MVRVCVHETSVFPAGPSSARLTWEEKPAGPMKGNWYRPAHANTLHRLQSQCHALFYHPVLGRYPALMGKEPHFKHSPCYQHISAGQGGKPCVFTENNVWRRRVVLRTHMQRCLWCGVRSLTGSLTLTHAPALPTPRLLPFVSC